MNKVIFTESAHWNGAILYKHHHIILQ